MRPRDETSQRDAPSSAGGGVGSGAQQASIAQRVGLRLRIGRVPRAIAACFCYLLIACLVFWPAGPLDQAQLPGGGVGDPSEMTWFLAWTPWALLHGHNLLLTHAIDLPAGVNLANNTSVPLLGLLGAPITLTLGPIATLNVLLRLALAASGAGVFFVARRWCRSDTGPFIAGLLFAFSPALVSHLQGYGHLDLIFLPFVPLMLWLFIEVLHEQRHRAGPIGLLLGLATAAEYLISAELVADCALLGVLGCLALVCVERARLKPKLHYIGVCALFGAATFLAICGYPIALALFGPGHLTGPVQSIAHLQRFRVDLAALVVPDVHVWLLPHALAATSATITAPVRRAGGAAELGGYLGLPFLLTVIALAIRCWRTRLVRIFCVMAAISLILSLGSRLEVGGSATSVPLPEVLLSKVPLLSSIVPARFSIFTLLFAAMVLAIGIDSVIGERARRFRTFGVAPALCAIGVAASLLSLAPRLPVASERPAESVTQASTIATLVPKGSVVLTYPYPDPPFALAMVWQARDNFGFSLLGGYANIRSLSGTGQLFPLLTEPAYIQEFLAHAESGRKVHFPLPGVVSDPTAALCGFLEQNHVTAVLYTPYGPGTVAAHQLFVNALGRPNRELDAFSLWIGPSIAGCGLHPRTSSAG